MSLLGQTEKNSLRANVFRVAPDSGHCSMQSALRICATERTRLRGSALRAGQRRWAAACPRNGRRDWEQHPEHSLCLPCAEISLKSNGPWTIWPASQPAAMPTANMTRRLSPDMFIFASSPLDSQAGIPPLAFRIDLGESESVQNYSDVSRLERRAVHY
jgi:hypothetical protein